MNMKKLYRTLLQENLAKKRSLAKQSGAKMPELSENSETESGKGSAEGDAGAPAAFPSLSNSVLTNMGLDHKKGDPLPE